MFLDVSLTLVVTHSSVGDHGKVDALDRGCWFGGGGSIVIPQLHGWDAMVFGPRQHTDNSSRCFFFQEQLIGS
jgi:hypothetical protein